MNLQTLHVDVTPEEFNLSAVTLKIILAEMFGGALRLPHRWTEWKRDFNSATTQQGEYRIFTVEPLFIVVVNRKEQV